MRNYAKVSAMVLTMALLAGCSQKAQDTTDSQSTENVEAQSSVAGDTQEVGEVTTENSEGLLTGFGSEKKVPSITVTVEKEENEVLLGDAATVSEDTKYGAATISLSQEAFEAEGFTLGDSCDISFSNGYELSDVPYYNGYYVKNGEPVLVAYPGFSNISITYNNLGIWEQAGLKDGDTITITLAEAGKYAPVQEVLGQQYSFNRTDYTSDEEFCNFRALSGGSLKADFLYRGASPVDNSRNRAPYTDGLLEKTGIQFVVDLADSESDMEGYIASDDFASEYTRNLYENGQDALLSMGSSYSSDVYKQKVAEGMKQLMAAEGPAYIHCMEGKDRTGFVCFLIEALCGATYEEMRDDYMMTYQNYYHVTAEGTPEKYEAIRELYFDAFAAYLHGTEDLVTLQGADYSEDAANYLMAGGMSAEEVEELRDFLTK